MKIIFFGSANFAVPSLNALIDSDHEILEVVTQCDKPAGRGLKIKACPVAERAREAGLSVNQPLRLKDKSFLEHILDLKPDVIVVVAYGKILPKVLLEIPRYKCINVHSSLLPKYRGAAPINWAIARGETETGVTTMFINEKMDAGDILLSCPVSIDELDSAQELETRLEQIGAELLLLTLKGVEERSIAPMPQDESSATYAPLLKKEDGLIDWARPAREIYNHIRGMLPWPVAYTHLNGKILRIFEAHISDEDYDGEPGVVLHSNKYLSVATGSGVLYLLEVQIEGKKRMHCEDMLRGCKIKEGTRLG